MIQGHGTEWHLAEKPTLEYLRKSLGYEFIAPKEHANLRDGENQVIFHPHLVAALKKINGISTSDARAAVVELSRKEDNEEWTEILRGSFSRPVEGQITQKTLKLIDFHNPSNNHFAITHQLRVKAEKYCIPDIVVYVNGIPLVVIEAKSPANYKDKNGEAFEQIKQYEHDIPRLFYTNAFNIITNGTTVLYGTTNSPAKFYSYWRDSYPHNDDFASELHKGLWCLLEPSRLLDLLAHFIVFERDAGTNSVTKKICRYQQYRAVNKMVKRVVDGKHKRGLIWHTQGSGKSLTMVFAVLKLKHHRTIQSPTLANPNLLILTDRKDLDKQITNTFIATRLPNPTSVKNQDHLRELIDSEVNGQTLLSTIFKFADRTDVPNKAVSNSENWIVMVDECHRTQEMDLGALLRATFPKAIFFGFTGTPIRKNDKNTYENFGVAGEGYLDKYSIDDAVKDNATVPICYTIRKIKWKINEAKIDSQFDTSFADISDKQRAIIKKCGLKIANLVRHPKRIELIASDLWEHFKGYAMPDGYKAQLVACDRETVILYKQALDKLIATDYEKKGHSSDAARLKAQEVTACVYSESSEDTKPSEDKYNHQVREQLVHYYLDDTKEKKAKEQFKIRYENPQILIVCSKLLTGFNAPAESVMYLDKYLKEHTLLQAIARTNRVTDATKKHGLIIDYIGVSHHWREALLSYRTEDVVNAMRNLDELRNKLKAVHREVMAYVKDIKRTGKDLKAEYDTLVKAIGTEDEWILFQRKVRDFVSHYEALAPDPSVLEMSSDLKWFANFLLYGRQVFDKKESLEQSEYSEKIRTMLEEHVNVTGLSAILKLRSEIDSEFWEDFENAGDDEESQRSTALKKTTELRKITEAKLSENYHQYAKFSEKLKALIERMNNNQFSWGDKLKTVEQFAKELEAETNAHKDSGMSTGAHALLKVVESVTGTTATPEQQKQLAEQIEQIYTDPTLTPKFWHTKNELKKELRQEARSKAHKLGFKHLKKLSFEIEDIALKHYAKGEYD